MAKTKSKKVTGKYGKYSSRKKGKQYEIRKMIKGNDFTACDIDESVAIKLVDTQIDKYYEGERISNKKITVSQYADNWLQDEKSVLRSYEYYEQHVRCYIKPTIGEMAMTNVKFGNLQSILTKMAKGELSTGTRKKNPTDEEIEESKKPLSKKTQDNVRDTVQQLFGYAIKNEDIKYIPLKTLKTYEIDTEEKPILNLQEERKLIQYLVVSLLFQIQNGEPIDDSKLMILLMDLRGLRASEACGIEVGDVLIDEHKLKISDGLQRIKKFDNNNKKTGYEIKKTKVKSKKSKRTIILGGIILFLMQKKYEEYIKKCKENNIEIDTEDYLFRTKTGKLPTTRNLYKALNRILKKLGLSHIGTHSLRRQCATKAFENDCDIRSVQNLLGHADIRMTQLYTRERDEKKAKEMAKIDNGVMEMLVEDMKKFDFLGKNLGNENIKAGKP